MRSLTVQEKVGQLFVLPFYGDNPNSRTREYKELYHWVRDLRIGGLILINRTRGGTVQRAQPYAVATFLNRVQKLAKVPLLVAGDFERGVSMRVESTTVFPHAMAFGAGHDPSASRFEGEVTAREARALGFQWILAPDADVNNNPDNPIINIRSYGENPQDVAAHVAAFIEGAHSNPKFPVLVTAKHFPGHGDTAVDTHMGLATIGADRARLDKVELPPFRRAIAAKVDAIMTAHIAVPALDAPDVPATLSRKLLTGLLRQELGFGGIIVTDALEMGGVSGGGGSGEVAVRALEAGADVLLMPSRPEEAIRVVVNAVREGRITRERLDQSVERILAAKARVGLDRKRLVDLEAISDELDSPEVLERAQEIADHAVTLVKNNLNVVPLKPADSVCFLVLAEGRRSVEGQKLLEELRRRSPKAPAILLDPSVPDAELDNAAGKATACDKIVVAAFVSVGAYRGNVALEGNFPKLIEALVASKRPVALVALGSPYLLRSFPGVSSYLATCSTVPTSETAAVKALYGEIPVTGRLPVTVVSPQSSVISRQTLGFLLTTDN
jgi:beta-N-acetylhexosaminidase